MLDGVRVYSADNYRLGLAAMAVFAAIGFAGTCLVRETYCRNQFERLD
jgi:hypothetical protein